MLVLLYTDSPNFSTWGRIWLRVTELRERETNLQLSFQILTVWLSYQRIHSNIYIHLEKKLYLMYVPLFPKPAKPGNIIVYKHCDRKRSCSLFFSCLIRQTEIINILLFFKVPCHFITFTHYVLQSVLLVILWIRHWVHICKYFVYLYVDVYSLQAISLYADHLNTT